MGDSGPLFGSGNGFGDGRRDIESFIEFEVEEIGPIEEGRRGEVAGEEIGDGGGRFRVTG